MMAGHSVEKVFFLLKKRAQNGAWLESYCLGDEYLVPVFISRVTVAAHGLLTQFSGVVKTIVSD